MSLLVCAKVNAQDLIILNNDALDEYQVKVVEVTNDVVKYKKWSYQDGPTFSLETNSILYIKYQNGDKQTFTQIKSKGKNKQKSSNKKNKKQAKIDKKKKTRKQKKSIEVVEENNENDDPVTTPTSSVTKKTSKKNDNIKSVAVVESSPNPIVSDKPDSPKKYNYKAWDFSAIGISYCAPFDFAGQGHYMWGGTSFPSEKGWGIDFHVGLNAGLVDSDNISCSFLVGPAYGYVINNLMIATSLNFNGVYANKFNWGIALMPKAVIKLGKVQPWLGVNAIWSKGSDKLGAQFQIGVAFDI